MYILNIFKAVCSLNYVIFPKSSDSPSNSQILGPPKLTFPKYFNPPKLEEG